jgi:hypothetical protein
MAMRHDRIPAQLANADALTLLATSDHRIASGH